MQVILVFVTTIVLFVSAKSKPAIEHIPLSLDNSLDGFDGYLGDLLSTLNGARIVNGSTAAVNQFPFFVAVRSYTNRGLKSICGGSLISRSWVLTAAHCTYGYTTFNLGLGSRTLNKPFISLTSERKIEHHRYNPINLNNDIALIGLPRPMVFTAFVQAIQMPTLRQAMTGRYHTAKARVCGFGRTNNVSQASSGVSPMLQWVDKRIISNRQCSQTFGSNVVISSTMCGIGWKSDSQTTCNGDSGGPLVIDEGGVWTQIGIVSFVSNRGCGSGDPAGYVRTTAFLNWVSINTGMAIRTF